jgi:ABC-type glutathione transport system ATPase component
MACRFEIREGETLGLVGESGCGKSTLRSRVTAIGSTSRAGTCGSAAPTCATRRTAALRAERRHLQMIFQDPYASLDPRMTVGEMHRGADRDISHWPAATRRARVAELIGHRRVERASSSTAIRTSSPAASSNASGSRARLPLDPDFIVARRADERRSTSRYSAQIMNLLERLQRERRLTYLFISHDLRAVRHLATAWP